MEYFFFYLLVTDWEVACHKRNQDYWRGKGDMGRDHGKLCVFRVWKREENKNDGDMEICCVATNSLYDFHGQELCLLHC